MAIRLYKASEIADMLGVSRQAIDQAIEGKRIEKNHYVTGEIRGWTAEQVERIRKEYRKNGGIRS